MDPEAQAPEQAAPDTPTTAADTQAEIDWRKRYEDLQPEYTRKSQSAAEFERLRTGQNPEALKEILDAYGYELADDDEPDEPDPDPEPVVAAKPDPRIDEIAKWQQEIQAERAEQAFNKDLKKAAGDRAIPEQGRDWILQRTINGGGDYKALEQATQAWVEFEDGLVNAASRKPRPRAPHVPSGGTPAPEGKDPADMSLSELNRFAMDRVNAETA